MTGRSRTEQENAGMHRMTDTQKQLAMWHVPEASSSLAHL